MKYTVKLVTDTPMERSVQKFAPDPVNADGMGRLILHESGRKAGDRVEIYETQVVLVGTLVLTEDGIIDRIEPEGRDLNALVAVFGAVPKP